MDNDRKHYQYFQNRECEYFPCHPGADPGNFNCLFCYCPLYVLGDSCGGNFSRTEKGLKDCTPCLVPHLAENYERIVRRYGDIVKQMKQTAGAEKEAAGPAASSAAASSAASSPAAGTKRQSAQGTENPYILWKELKDYSRDGILPMHMPGHKRRIEPAPGLSADIDLTEVEGVDDLHHADGILRQAMDRTASFFGADRTWYLVGGSTVGNLAMISAAVPYCSEVICARNCHRSVLHACALRNLTVHWIYPDTDPESGICLSVRPGQVRRTLAKYPQSRAVILTSPTYEGIVSDIRSIADICHSHIPGKEDQCRMASASGGNPGQRQETRPAESDPAGGTGIPLLVDEAHGAHFGLFPEAGFPDSAIHLGADVCVQSAHKTLPSLTQTALLHWKSALVRPERIDEQLDIYETSSPSYPLMVSLDGCTGLLAAEGRKWFARWKANLDELYGRLENCVVLKTAEFAGESGVFARDRSKVLISGKKAGISGEKLAQRLRERFRIETEMSAGWNVLAMTSCADRREDLMRFADAVCLMDRELTRAGDAEAGVSNETLAGGGNDAACDRHRKPEGACCKAQKVKSGDESLTGGKTKGYAEAPGHEQTPVKEKETPNPAAPLPGPETSAGMLQAMEAPAEYVSFADAAGRVSGESVFVYPPGIPLIVPGEQISEETAETLCRMEREGVNLRFSGRDPGRPSGEIRVLCKTP
ncbi:MAG: cysteine-rich small domain-containing protein [Lachnospiraceae bacterium]|jgi:arginine decarboxylase